MFFILSKLLAFTLTPLCWVIAILIFTKWFKKGVFFKKGLIVSGVMLYVFSNSFIVDELVRHWETPAIADTELQPTQMVVVLGGMSSFDPELKRIKFNAASDRLWQGIRLLKQGYVQQLIVTGGSGSLSDPHLKEAFFIRDFLTQIGVNSSQFLYENESKNTYENAVNTKQIVDSLGVQMPIVLVTSSMHMKRSVACFAKQGIDVIAYSTDRHTGQNRVWHIDHLLFPSAGALSRFSTFLHEFVGYYTYKLKGYC